jgi:large subunit ribosomal protein L13
MLNVNKTYFAKPSTIIKKWILVDAKDQVLGRLASQISKILRGKHKVYYTPHLDCGDNVIVINVKHVKLTGKKFDKKLYYRHTGYPGGIKCQTAGQIIEGTHPTRILSLAVKRMLPKESPLARKQLKNLYIYSELHHPHKAQNPISIKLVK